MNVPEGWSRIRFDDVASLRNGLNFDRDASGAEAAILGVADFVGRDVVDDSTPLNRITLPGSLPEDARLQRGDLIFVRSNGSKALVGRSLIFEGTSRIVGFSGFTIRARLDANLTDGRFILNAMRAPQFRAHLQKLGRGSSINNLSQDVLSSFTLMLPPLPEQRKIAEVLRTWDDAIERTAALRQHSQRKLKALQAMLFSASAVRAAGWKSHPLGSLSTRVSRKSDGEAHTVMTISAKSGFVSQVEKYSRDMAGANVANYTLLRKGEFAYNKGNSLTYPQGCVFALSQGSALVPNVYFSFALDDCLNARFYEHLFAAGYLNRQLARVINSGVRGNGLLNVSANDFFGVHVPVPNRETQDRIAATFDLAKTEIDALDRQVALLRAQKRGLMQKLLTGEVRVQPDNHLPRPETS